MNTKQWKLIYIGKVNIKKGDNTIIITKDKTTDAAFIMNQIILNQTN
ncbi:MAG: hypothetical protein GWP09_03060 [Nitrospiraceae bacterium]|nr:hypothetical protein [Nitrospiraceae bacterium]